MYGSYTSNHYHILEGYRNSSYNFEYDTAVIKLPSAVDERVGFLNVSTERAVHQEVQVVGYSGQNSHKLGNMYYMQGNVDSIVENTFDYMIDTEKDQSGGPVLDQNNKIVGVHVAGFYSYGNRARLIKQDTLNMIKLAQESGQPTEGIISSLQEYPPKNCLL